MLSLLFGMPDSDRNEVLAQELLKRKGSRSCLVLVPEQFSVTMERQLLERLGDSLSLWVEVLSFRRLPDYVFDRLGGRKAQMLNEGGMRILLSGALAPLRESLRYFGQASLKSDFIELLRNQFREFAAYETDPDELFALANALPSQTLSDKLFDLALLYQGLLAQMQGRRSAEFALDAAAELLRQDNLFASSDLFLWNFKGFTPQEYEVLEIMLASGSSVTVALLGEDVQNKEDSPLFPCLETAEHLRRLAAQVGCGEAPERWLPPAGIRSGALAHLERYAFRQAAPEWEGKPDSLTEICAASQEEEAEFVASRILSLVRTGNRWNEIAVILRQPPTDMVLEMTFRRFGIPVQIDNRGSLVDKPLCGLLFAAIQAVTGGFVCDDVLAYLKTGLAGLTLEECDFLERYAWAWNLRGSRWTSPFRLHPDGYGAAFDEDAHRRLARLEQLRQRTIEPLTHLKEALDAGGAHGISCALYALMEEVGLSQQLRARCEEARQSGEEAVALEYEQTYEAVVELLEQMEAFAEEEVPARRYAELLRLAASQSRLGIIPAALDQVMVLGADRVMPGMVSHAFLMDFTQDRFPKPLSENGLLTEKEKEELRANRLKLSPGLQEQAREERYYAYLAMMAPTESLTISYALRAGGEERKPSPYLYALRGLFPRLTPVEVDRGSQTAERIVTAEQAIEQVLTLPQDPLSHAIRRALEKDETLAGRLAEMEQAVLRGRSDPVFSDPALARQLYRRRGALSPTTLEKYAQCPFSYFCQYGLRLKPRRRHEFDALQTGTFMHYVLERFFRSFSEELKQGNAEQSEQKVQERADAIIEEFLLEYLPDFDEQDARFRMLFQRLREILYHTLNLLTEELRSSEFVPVDFELSIGEDIPALQIGAGEDAVTVRGQIDRVDLLRKEGKTYLRILDYKTGKKHLDYAELYRGIGQQMLLYLDALLKNGGQRYGDNILPAGVVYVPVRLDVVQGKDREISDEGLRKGRKPRRNGLLLDDEQVLHAMDHSGAFSFLPVTAREEKGGGAIIDRRFSSLATLEQLGMLFHYTEDLLEEMAGSLRKGRASIDPVKSAGQDGVDACRFCDMRAVCLREGEAQELAPLAASDFWKLLRQRERTHPEKPPEEGGLDNLRLDVLAGQNTEPEDGAERRSETAPNREGDKRRG